ncbi:MAG: alpha-hydroxy-acid oxidizing protein [Lachnospiraceae bacterium]|nr:alpha-hydroxy-acid oxidizing protein [Lachnospiraceae bacterium]
MGYTAKTDELTREYFDSILISTRYLDSDLPSLDMELWGENFKTPVMTAALSHLHNICDNAMAEFAKGAKDAGAVNFVGMTEEDELEGMLATGARTVKIVKPHEKDEKVREKIEHATTHGAFAVGMDIDHAISWEGKYDVVCGFPMKPTTTAKLSEYVKMTDRPFVVKGVLSTADAEKCVEAGAAGIVVSHHHGIMDYMVPPLMVLPEIVKAVDGQLKIFVDCGIERGADVFKALALGADAVCVGRALMDPLKNGAKGVTEQIEVINRELKVIMARTGAKSLKEIDPSVLKFRAF